MKPAGTPDLVINLQAIVRNWKMFRSRLATGVRCGAVVKANAYGLGMEPVVRELVLAGCRDFYVANLREAMATREVLNHLVESLAEKSPSVAVPDYCIYVLSGCAPGEEAEFLQLQCVPVLVSLEMLNRWIKVVGASGLRSSSVRAALKVDTGMARLGLEPDQFSQLLKTPEVFTRAGVGMLMSHLACADNPQHPQNRQQLQRFASCLSALQAECPAVTGCLANSAGILLSPEYHFQGVRPGIGLYGGNPCGTGESPVESVVSLRVPVLQTRVLPEGGAVGYGASYQAHGPARLATVAGGYADGIFRYLGNQGSCWVADRCGGPGWRAPIVGRISMDSTIIDVSHIPESAVREGDRVELLGSNIGIDEVASAASTISYEILTSLGSRYSRAYVRD